MRYLFDDWKNIQKKIQRSSLILLASDYDGTLTPIVSRPELAKLRNNIRKILVSLSKCDKFKVGIISGRRLSSVEGLVRVKNIYYAGNHGLEIKGPKVNFTHPAYYYFRPCIKTIKERLKKRLKGIKGLIVEDKSLTLSVHYRLVDSENIAMLKRIFRETVASYIKKNSIRIFSGKKVFEIRPPVEWDKGKALEMIESLTKTRSKQLRIYLGDDTTDEDAFKVLSVKDISVFVGKKKKSKARYFLNDTHEVEDFLKRLLRLKK